MGGFKSKIVSFLLLLIVWGNILAQSIPEKPTTVRYVNDFAQIFSESQREELEYMLKSYKDTTSTQIVVVSVKSLEGMDASQYAAELGEKWGVGQKQEDNGIVFLIAPTERKMFIATGRGTQDRLTDVYIARIRDNYILPEFKRGDYYSGTTLGVKQIMNKLSGAFKADSSQSNEEIELTTSDIIKFIIIFIIILWIISKISKAVNYGETYSSRGYRGGLGGGFWGSSGGIFGGGGSSWGSSGGGDSWGGGSFDGGGAGGDW